MNRAIMARIPGPRLIPNIGETVHHWYDGEWVWEALTQARIGDRQFLLVWSASRTEFEPEKDVWRD